jgi:phosphoglycerol transferase MdoB-like AlkP superfamily enzyme
LAVLRDSAATLKKTWGESLVGFVGLQLGGAAILFLTIVFVVVEVLAFVVFHQGWLIVGGALLWLTAVLAISFFLSIATHVYRCALYVYASEGVVPQSYTREMMDAGWKVKKV